MSQRYRFGPFELDAAEHSLAVHGRRLALIGRAFDTLLYLVRHPGRLVTRGELIGAVWGETIVEEGNLHWTISAVRKTLAQESPEPFIETARGLGYRFVAPVEVVGDSPAAKRAESPALREAEAFPRAGSRTWTAAGLAALLLLTSLAWIVTGRYAASPSSSEDIAVVGFRNLSPQGAGGWVGTALTEMLAADLGRGGALRVVPSDDVASMRRDLGLRLSSPIGPGELARIRRRLGSEWVIVGSYLRLKGEDPPLRVDALLRNTATGATRTIVSRRGRERDLFTLTDGVARDLRRALGEPAVGEGGIGKARGVMPAAPRAQQLYAEGLERLQRRDAQAAVERLKAATEADPGFPGAWHALAQAYGLLGFDRQAEDAAFKAVQRSLGLPERQRLTIEAAYLHLVRRRPEAVDRRRRVYELSGEFEDGIELSRAQAFAGQGREALASTLELRKRYPDHRDDARLALHEQGVYLLIEDYPKANEAGERAIAAARRQGMVQAEIAALHLTAIGRIRVETVAVCRPVLEQINLARRKAEALGDRLLLADVLNSLGFALSDCEDSQAAAERAYQAEADIYRQIGAPVRLAPVLHSLSSIRDREGDLLGAERLEREAYEGCLSTGLSHCGARYLIGLGLTRLRRGEPAEARRMIEEGIRLNEQLGSRFRVGEAQSFLAELAAWSGDLGKAVELERRDLAGQRQIGLSFGIGSAHSNLAYWLAEAGRGSEALANARQALAILDPSEEYMVAFTRASLASALLVSGDLEAADRESARASSSLPLPREGVTSYLIWRIRAQVLLRRGQLAAAEALIGEGLDLARRNGYVAFELQGRLLQAELVLARGRPAEARQLAADLAAEARAKGFGLIAQRCAAVIAGAQDRVPLG